MISLIFGTVNGRLAQTVAAAFSGAESAAGSVLAMAGVLCFWTGLLSVSEKSGFCKIISKIISPMLQRLFPKLKKEEKAFSYICMNVVANLFGMGNAATPAGLEAMRALDEKNGYSEYASDEMCMLVVINTASLQLIPTTVIALRSSNGAENPAAVIVPIWIASGIALISSVMLFKLMSRRRKKL